MNFILKNIWPNPSNNNIINIPTHLEGEDEDDLDLKIASLQYFYKRYKFWKFPNFLNNFQDYQIEDLKLDYIYNRKNFEFQLQNDEHRILIDWYKNKFRSLMILSNNPSTKNLNQLNFNDQNFKFLILKPNDSIDLYIEILINQSNIYLEHNDSINYSIKLKILTNFYNLQKKFKPSYKPKFNKNDRSIIILNYLQKISEIVQIDRILKVKLIEYIQFKSNIIVEEEEEEENIPRSRLDIPNNRFKSPRSSSPIKSLRKTLNKKQSMTLIKLDKSLQDQNDYNSNNYNLSKEEIDELKSKAERSVMFRIEREKQLIMNS
ncbi:hypothetical protein WICMUC_004579 [Wickerhamomyces mucosus]|uniref:Uncharacterized protein n=1 Tax=Wickerhamomyces mucosus TaxID=1378264 RepID=A0A9P8PGE8_9ASCO|nr:hypothetical protein WICMUC_004579 [Wickerhamomyces mucosus]